MPNKTEREHIKTIWEKVKELEEHRCTSKSELDMAKSTMLLNFGLKGRCVKDLINGSENSLADMIVKVFTYYVEKYGKEPKDA